MNAATCHGASVSSAMGSAALGTHLEQSAGRRCCWSGGLCLQHTPKESLDYCRTAKTLYVDGSAGTLAAVVAAQVAVAAIVEAGTCHPAMVAMPARMPKLLAGST